MPMWCGSGACPVPGPRKVLERNAASLPNVLVIGRDGARRALVARLFHASRFQKSGVFTMLRCGRKSHGARSEFLNLFFALTRNGQCSGSPTSELLSGGTLFIDEIEKMELEGQRICLEFLKQLHRRRNERPGQVGLRVVAGLGKGLSEATAQGGFLPELLDLLDKMRVELDARGRHECESQLPTTTLVSV